MRTYRRKPERADIPLEVYLNAGKIVSDEGKSIRKVVKEFLISYVTLSTIIKKQKEGLPVNFGYARPRKGFDTDEENALREYLLKCATI